MTRTDKVNKKDCMFQYATLQKVIEDTDLITRDKADKLVEKYLDDLKSRWNEYESPQFGIWVDCDSNTNYHIMGLDIDYRDCELSGGHFYRVEKKKII